jgi:ATP-dependent Clp protease adaptor protein ClpS
MSEPTTLPVPKEDTATRLKHQPPYHVILLNDDDHSFEYVVAMLQQLFGHPVETGYQMAVKVHTEGRVIVDTTTRERAELKQEQIHAFGPDPLIKRCAGSMTAVIEPAE